MRGEEWGQIRSTVAGSGPGREEWGGLEEHRYTQLEAQTTTPFPEEKMFCLGLNIILNTID